MLGYIPYSRRKVTSLSLPMLDRSVDEPAFMHKLHRLTTVAAPWTPEERWRSPAEVGDSDGEDDDVGENGSEQEVFELEKEEATITQPETIDIWFEADQFPGDAKSLVGAGLRGRWALMGVAGGKQWWTYKAKDCESRSRHS